MNNLKVIEVKGIRVLTTKQIAELYKAEEWQVKHNFENNKAKYVEGKHYIFLYGNELKEFKNQGENFSLVKSRACRLYLWTEKGALLHAKSINTDKAWEVYEYLVDFYFRVKEQPQQQASQEERGRLVVDAPENTRILEAVKKVKDDLTCMNVLLDHCNMFVSKEEYDERRKQAEEIVSIIRADMSRFTTITPNMIRKTY